MEDAQSSNVDSKQRSSNQRQGEAEHPSEKPTIWLCQYRRSEMKTLEQRMAPGLEERWRIHPYSPIEIEENVTTGDVVAFWRTVDKVKHQGKPKSRGGIVGWGKIQIKPNDFVDEQISIQLSHAFPDNPIPRDHILRLLGREGSNWPGERSLKLLNRDEAAVFQQFMLTDDGQPIVQEFHETQLASDRAETTRDLLGRAPLAFTIAHHINRIWTEQTKPAQKGEHDRAPDEAAFIMHIDAPWGGGKTTFANFVSRILHPQGYDLDPTKLGEDDYSLFADLRLDDGDYWPKSYARRKWITITFNAWQNQHVSPPWWNFYETIRKQCVAALPFDERWRNRISEWIWRFWSPATRRAILTTILLGITAFFVYKSEFFDWIQEAKVFDVQLSTIITAIASGSVGVFLFGSIRSGLSTLIQSVSDSIDAQKLGEADPLERFRRHFANAIRQYGRPILVIVDDLDRCDPKYVVELVRGMLTIFRSPRVVFVLLGDKSWIETSFAKVYKEMADAYKDDKSTFGGRFAEKAIQLSFILPEPQAADRDAYIDYLLVGQDPAQKESVTSEGVLPISDVKVFEEETKARFRDAISSRERKAVLEETRRIAGSQFASSPSALRTTTQIINREAAMRAASSERTETEIRHGISALKAELPDNPRRIKRIINMIATYQASAQSVLGVDPGTDRWRQLVLWIVLMSEHPEGWRILSARPHLADKVISGEKQNEERQPSTSTQENPEPKLLATLSQINIAHLIKGEAFEKENVQLDTEAVRWLRRLTPLA